MRSGRIAIALVCLAQNLQACQTGRTEGGAGLEGSSPAQAAGNSGGTSGEPGSITSPLSSSTNGADDGGIAAALQPIANTMAGYTTVGRFIVEDGNSMTFALPSSRIGGSFTGTSLAVRLADTGHDRFDVTIDGTTLIAPNFALPTPCTGLTAAQAVNANVTVTSGCIGTTPSAVPQDYVVAKNLAAGHHTAWLIKRTEFYQGTGTSAVGQTTFYGFVLDANATLLTPPAASTRRIDFVGDSSFTGYGAGQLMHGAADYCDFTADNQDAAASVPYYTGEFLLAGAINVSSSGQAVVASVYDPNPSHLLPVMYEEALPPAANPPADFAKSPADVVVLNAGGDDLLGPSGAGYFPNHDANTFIAGYTAWLTKIRQHYPKALIVCALTSGASGADIATLGSAIQAAMANAAAAGDQQLAYFNYFSADPPYTTYDDIATALQLYYGCKYHPSPAGASWLAKRLAQFIGSKMGWTVP